MLLRLQPDLRGGTGCCPASGGGALGLSRTISLEPCWRVWSRRCDDRKVLVRVESVALFVILGCCQYCEGETSGTLCSPLKALIARLLILEEFSGGILCKRMQHDPGKTFVTVLAFWSPSFTIPLFLRAFSFLCKKGERGNSLRHCCRSPVFSLQPDAGDELAAGRSAELHIVYGFLYLEPLEHRCIFLIC